MEEITAGEYFSVLQRRLSRKRMPQQATLELTHRCNFNCIHCYLGDSCKSAFKKPTRELNLNQWKGILGQLTDMGVLGVTFTGGEIFLRNDILDLLIYARKKGFWVNILTNASLLDEKIIDELIKHNIRKIEVSFQGITKATFERITRAPGSYEPVLRNLRLMREKGLTPAIKTCLLNLNSKEIIRIIDFAKQEGFSFRHWEEVIPRFDRDKAPTFFRLSPGEFLRLEEKLAKHIRKLNMADRGDYRAELNNASGEKLKDLSKINPGEINVKPTRRPLFNCQAGNNMLCINPFGMMKACIILSFPSYDILKGNVKEGWEQVKKFVDSIRKPRNYKCDRCSLSQICQPCPAKRFLETGDMVGCIDYWRQVARIEKNRPIK